MSEKDCLFCKIIKKNLPSQKVFENDKVFSFKDIHPQAPVHILIVPKAHIESILDVNNKNKRVFEDLFFAAQQISREVGIAETGFRTVFNTLGHACQSVFHMHLHLLGGTQLGGSMVG